MEALQLEQSSREQPLREENGDYRHADGVKAWIRIVHIESILLWRLGFPMALQIICQYATESVATMFVGHIGDVELSAFSIAVSVFQTFAFGLMLGLGSALETLCGQAFGAGQAHMLGVYTQRSILISLTTCALISPFYIFATPILKLVGITDEIATRAGFYTLLILPQMFSLSLSFPTEKFLQAQSKVGALSWIAVFSLIAQTCWCWLFVNILKWGPMGAALAYDLTAWGTAIMQLIYVVRWGGEGWTGFTWAAFTNIWAFVRLSFGSAVMLCLELWYPMSVTLLAGHLGNAVTAVGSLSICMNIDAWESLFFMGVNGAISTRVANEIGGGHPRAAKYLVYVTIFQSFLIGVLCMIVVLLTRRYFANIFTSSEEIKHAVAHLSGLLGITMVLNSMQPVISGVAVGLGWQVKAAYINLGCYYAFGLPLGCVLGYVAHFGVMGIWGGMIAGVAAQTLALVFVLYRINWNNEAEQTVERMMRLGGQEVNG